MPESNPINPSGESEEIVRMTSYSHGAGCGCKLSPRILEDVLRQGETAEKKPASLLVGNDSRDDAAVYDLGDGRGLISTTDFFLPIVDDPFDFGRIAATNAISDVYAMGGTPTLAIAILGWPIDKLSPAVANRVVEGGRAVCAAAGIPLAGGHSIDNPEPLFGLAVNGLVDLKNLKRNDGAAPGNRLYLTKPLGIGILTTAGKNKVLKAGHRNIASDLMLLLNKAGQILARIPGVRAMTDVTGFGLLGHLLEICRGSGVAAELDFDAVPVIPEALEYIGAGQIPGGTRRNWSSFKAHVDLGGKDSRRTILSDAQTSGGLLIACDEESSREVESVLKEEGLNWKSIGRTISQEGPALIRVI
jgi:selenide,water dikinase